MQDGDESGKQAEDGSARKRQERARNHQNRGDSVDEGEQHHPQDAELADPGTEDLEPIGDG